MATEVFVAFGDFRREGEAHAIPLNFRVVLSEQQSANN